MQVHTKPKVFTTIYRYPKNLPVIRYNILGRVVAILERCNMNGLALTLKHRTRTGGAGGQSCSHVLLLTFPARPGSWYFSVNPTARHSILECSDHQYATPTYYRYVNSKTVFTQRFSSTHDRWCISIGGGHGRGPNAPVICQSAGY
jgi:hypothetical protein